MYEPTDAKKLQRQHMFVQAGVEVGRLFSTVATERYGIKGSAVNFKSRSDSAERLVNIYEEAVISFKTRHKYGVNSSTLNPNMINTAKIESLTLLSISIIFSIDDLFAVDDTASKSALNELIFTYFSWRITCGILFVDIKRLPTSLERDFLYNVEHKNTISEEWLCWAMEAFRSGYGDPDQYIRD